MKVTTSSWDVTKLFSLKKMINEQPEYQRGEVWNDRKRALLIDSMLRGIDIPKLYLRKLENLPHEYEVADGQQRLTAILRFLEDRVTLLNSNDKGLDLGSINGVKVGGLKYSTLPIALRQQLDRYQLTVAIIEDAKPDEIRTLFGRLQEGVSLVPAEKRNAIISGIGKHVDSIALNHDFFRKSRILEGRYKRQDYAAHLLTLVAYNNIGDLKADLILKLYLDTKFVLTASELKKVTEVLDLMRQIDSNSKWRIYKKYHVIDVFWFLFQKSGNYSIVDIRGFAEEFDKFEQDRLKHYAEPRSLIQKPTASQYDLSLYSYILAFKAGGALVKNIDDRNKSMDVVFSKFLT